MACSPSKRRAAEEKARTLDSFNFHREDREVTDEVVEEVESKIQSLNEESYRLAQLIQRLEESLKEEKILFRQADAETLFQEAGVLLGDQIKKDYAQLVAFNRSITKERREALIAQLADARKRASDPDEELVEA